MTTIIDSIDALENVVGKTPPAVNLKVIDHVDATACRWLMASPLMFAAIGSGDGPVPALAGGAPGFAGSDGASLSLPLDHLDDPAAAVPGASFGSLFLIPGIGETLRINGRVRDVADRQLRVDVDECYGHCAKALIRSDFWQADPAAAPVGLDAFIAASRFMALATADGTGHADLSPKGDPAGAMVLREAGRLWFADRPGNRRTDSFRNILVQPRIGAALLVPGSNDVVLVRGRAVLTTADAERRRFAVQGKLPLLAIGIDEPEIELRPSAALARARLWPAAPPPQDIKPARMFAEHVKRNRHRGLAARAAAAAVSVPGFLENSLAKDYKDNLY